MDISFRSNVMFGTKNQEKPIIIDHHGISKSQQADTLELTSSNPGDGQDKILEVIKNAPKILISPGLTKPVSQEPKKTEKPAIIDHH